MSEVSPAPSEAPPDPYAVLAEACRRLGLRPHEAFVLRNALYARSYALNGHFLITPRYVLAAWRMIERGYLAEAKNQPAPFNPKGFGLVIVVEQEHLTKLIADANAITSGISL